MAERYYLQETQNKSILLDLPSSTTRGLLILYKKVEFLEQEDQFALDLLRSPGKYSFLEVEEGLAHLLKVLKSYGTVWEKTSEWANWVKDDLVQVQDLVERTLAELRSFPKTASFETLFY